MQQPLTPFELKKDIDDDDLISQKQAKLAAGMDSPSYKQYSQQQQQMKGQYQTGMGMGQGQGGQNESVVRNVLEKFEKMHKQSSDGDDDNDASPGWFNPPPSTISIGNQQRAFAEKQQMMAAKIHNSPMFDASGTWSSNNKGSGSSKTADDTTPLTPKENFDLMSILTTNQLPAPPNYTGAQQMAATGGTLSPPPLQMQAQLPNQKDMSLYDLSAPRHTENFPLRMRGGGNGGQNPSWKMTSNGGDGSDGGDLLIKKLNYVIHLLEEQKDEKTDNVMEEVVLYSFLGVFMIFIVDSFARVGKYVR
jgi:hypothetical protein